MRIRYKKWERIYYEEGPQALYEERRGRNKNMSSKSRKKKLSIYDRTGMWQRTVYI